VALAEKDADGTDNVSIGAIMEPEPEESTPTPEPEPEAEPEPEQSGVSAGTIIFVLLAALALGGAGYYIKVMRPKRQQLAETEDEEGWEDFFAGAKGGEHEDDGFPIDDGIEDPYLIDDELDDLIAEPTDDGEKDEKEDVN
jgi:hypothetical protein